MAKKRSKKIDKETRKIIEAVSDLVKKKGNDTFKIKAKKKQAKKIKMTCAHWIIHKGKECQTVTFNPENNEEWICNICHKTFPIKPLEPEQYDEVCRQFLQIVDQAFFYSVKLGGNGDDTKVFEILKKTVPQFNKIVKNEMKILDKRFKASAVDNKKDMNQFNAYAGLNIRP